MRPDVFILAALRAASHGAVAGTELAQALGISRAAVWAHVQELRALGYDIEASPHQGYRLLSSPDRIHADDLAARLGPGSIVGREIRVFQETTSTNDIVDRLGRDGGCQGLVVFAESQTGGRGRLGRSWDSPSGKGLWFSVLLRPAFHPTSATRLTIAAATATARAVTAETGVALQVKWPNDLLIRGRKVAGILTELSAELDHIKYMVLGIGVDVNQTAADFAPSLRRGATSLRQEIGRPIDRPALATRLLKELDRDYARIQSDRFEAVAEEWEGLCTTLGQHLAIRVGERVVRGRAESLDADGALLVRTQHGRLERVVGGDVTVEKG